MLSIGGQMKPPQAIQKLRDDFREQFDVDQEELENWPACLPVAGVKDSEDEGTPLFFNWEDHGLLPPPPGPTAYDYETLAPLDTALLEEKVAFNDIDFEEDDDDDEDYAPNDEEEEEAFEDEDEDEDEEDAAAAAEEEEPQPAAGVSSKALKPGRPAWAVKKPYPIVAADEDVDLIDDEDACGAGITAADDDDDDDDEEDEYFDDLDDDEIEAVEAAAAVEPEVVTTLVPPPLLPACLPVAGVPTRKSKAVALHDGSSPVSVAAADNLDSLASEYRASFAAPSAEALQSPFKERRKILRKNRKVALSSSVFEAEVTLRADVAKALSRAKTAVTTEEDADADDNDAAAAAPAVVAATTANIAVPTLAEGGAPLVPEPISVTDPVGAPPLQPFPMSPPPTATKELEERIEEIGDAEITSSIQSYATPGRMSAYLTEHVGSHWLRLVSSRAFRDWAKGRPHQFLSFVSARYDNVAVTVKLYEYETAGAKGASVGKSPGGTFAPAPSPPPKQKKARKGGEGSAGGRSKPPPPPYAVEKGTVWTNCGGVGVGRTAAGAKGYPKGYPKAEAKAKAPRSTAVMTAPASAAGGGFDEFFGLDEEDLDVDAEKAYAAARRGGIDDDDDFPGATQRAAGSPSNRGEIKPRRAGKQLLRRSKKGQAPAYMKATASWAKTVQERPVAAAAAAAEEEDDDAEEAGEQGGTRRWVARRVDSMAGRRPTQSKVARSKLEKKKIVAPRSSRAYGATAYASASAMVGAATPAELSKWSSARAKAAALRTAATARAKVRRTPVVPAHLTSPIFANRRWGDAPLRKSRKNTEYNINYSWK